MVTGMIRSGIQCPQLHGETGDEPLEEEEEEEEEGFYMLCVLWPLWACKSTNE